VCKNCQFVIIIINVYNLFININKWLVVGIDVEGGLNVRSRTEITDSNIFTRIEQCCFFNTLLNAQAFLTHKILISEFV